MYAEKTVLAYLPFTNVYITIKLAFGSMIAKIYMILYFLSFGLVFLHLEILTAILSLVSGVAFILVIIKLITGKYDLLYFEPSVNNTNNNVGSNEYNNYSNNVNNNVLNDLSNDDNFVICSLYGIKTKRITQKNLAKIFNYTQSCIAKKHNRILNLIKEDLKY